MTFKKLTTIQIVDAIEPCLPTWESLGYRLTVRVPEEGTLGFAILSGEAGELMFQTRASLADDLPDIAARKPNFMLYADVASVANARKAASPSEVIVRERRTFYGALESWLLLPGGTVLGLSEHS